MLDKNDLKVLKKVDDAGEGGWFDDGRSSRPSQLAEHGLITGRMRVWRIDGGGKSVEYRMSYTLTKEGRAALAKVS